MEIKRGYFKRAFAAVWKDHGILLSWVIIGSLVLGFVFQLDSSWILVFVLGLIAARQIATNLINNTLTYVTPREGGGLSLANPRVWKFEFSLSNKFINDVSTQLSERLDKHKKEGHYVPSSTKPLFATTQWLENLVIEEHPQRVRVHRWLTSDSDDVETESPSYEWYDVAISQFRKDEAMELWSYSSNAMLAGALSLSGSWQWDSTQQRFYFQLTFWVNHYAVRAAEDVGKIPPDDIIFKIPLEPGRLCDEQEELVYVTGQGGRQFIASEVQPFPYDKHEWQNESREGDDLRWRWYLRMETFNATHLNIGP